MSNENEWQKNMQLPGSFFILFKNRKQYFPHTSNDLLQVFGNYPYSIILPKYSQKIWKYYTNLSKQFYDLFKYF